MRLHRFAVPLAAAATLISWPASTYAQSVPANGWSPHLLLEGFAGNGSEEFGGDFRALLPFWQNPDNLAFLYPYYFYADDGDFQAGGAGVAWRTRISDEWIFGVYGFLDATRQYDEWFGQASLGAEALAEGWEARLNGYIPFGDDKQSGDPFAMLNEENYLEVLTSTNFGAYGVDGEVGARVLNWGDNDGDNELRLFGGAYAWWHNEMDTVAGASGRVEARFNDLPFLPEGGRLTLGASARYDDTDDFSAAAMASLRIPLGPAGQGKRHFGLDARMNEDIARRWGSRIESNEAVLPALFLDGRAAGQVVFTDGLADDGLDGWTPPTATELDQAISQAGTNGIVVALDQNGDILTPGAELLEGQAFIGGGTMLPLTSAQGGTFYYAAPGGPGKLVHNVDIDTIKDTGDFAYVLSLADYNTVLGIGIESVLAPNEYDLNVRLGGIYGDGKTGLWLADNTVEVGLTGGIPAATAATVTGPSIPLDGGAGEDVDLSTDKANNGLVLSQLVGISLVAASEATVSGNAVSVEMVGAGSPGRNATGGEGLAQGTAVPPDGPPVDYLAVGAGGSAVAADGGTGVRGSSVTGIDLSDSVNATLTANTVQASLTATGGDGGTATGGNAGDEHPDPTSFTDPLNGGEATGGNGGIGGEDVSATGAVLTGASDATATGNEIQAWVTGSGGAGGGAFGGKGGNNLGEGPADHGGSATAGNGANGLENATATGVVIDNTTGLTLTSNGIGGWLSGIGGPGGDAEGGAGGNGLDRIGPTDFGTGGSAGNAIAGNGGAGIVSGTTLAIRGNNAVQIEIRDNTVYAGAAGTGGHGGTATGGTAGFGYAFIRSGVGGTAQAGTGGIGLGDIVDGTVEVRAIFLENAVGGSVADNTVAVDMSGTGGDGGSAEGGDGDSVDIFVSGEATGGDGNVGIRNATVNGLDANTAQDTTFSGNVFDIAVNGNGGNGGSANAGNAISQELERAGGNATGGGGAQGILTLDGYGIDLRGSSDALANGNSLSFAAVGTGGDGGDATGGDGSNSVRPPRSLADGGEGGSAIAGSGARALQDFDFAGIVLTDSSGGTLAENALALSATGTGGSGGGAIGGNGGNKSADTEPGDGGAGGHATGGDGLNGFSEFAMTGVQGLSDAVFEDNSIEISALGTGGSAGDATGGTGGNTAVDVGNGGAGGDALAGEAREGGVFATIIGVSFQDGPAAAGASAIGNTVDVEISGQGGLGGTATGGDAGGTSATGESQVGGNGGAANASSGGIGLNQAFAVAFDLTTAEAATLTGNGAMVTVSGTGAAGGAAYGGNGGLHDGGIVGDASLATGGMGGLAVAGSGGAGLMSAVAVGANLTDSDGATVLGNSFTISASGIGADGGEASGGNGGDRIAASGTNDGTGGAGGDAIGGGGGHGGEGGPGAATVAGLGGSGATVATITNNVISAMLSLAGGDGGDATGGAGGSSPDDGTGGAGGNADSGNGGDGSGATGALVGVQIVNSDTVEKTGNDVMTATDLTGGLAGNTYVGPGGTGGTGGNGANGSIVPGSVGDTGLTLLAHFGYAVSDTTLVSGTGNLYSGAGVFCSVLTSTGSIEVNATTCAAP